MRTAGVERRRRYRKAAWIAAAVALAVAVIKVTIAAGTIVSGPAVMAAGKGPEALVVTPDGRILYVADWGTAGTGAITATP